MATETRLYDIASVNGEDDYLPELGLDRIGELIAKLPDDFDLGNCQSRAASVTATIKFPRGDVLTNPQTLEAMLHAVTIVRTLHANLVAARARLAEMAVRVIMDSTEDVVALLVGRTVTAARVVCNEGGYDEAEITLDDGRVVCFGGVGMEDADVAAWVKRAENSDGDDR